ncbi:hypothetical protein ASPZODRAFT_136167 [Penicilliopsis zonata CBS 506.65]|uniref:Protein SQS1 n=1 Tax=Penicilliopsis zonata CBS 506.65 TaxID=1073090 RepID=A0A1L9S845_9EURO|nr:hypothetical protein ASPZODRAFT_136167 [Penicilliopsis zonata CBS 506.65]OJJ43327.1 hypothetical protein ASPZODRAFT_136167 [Penicilliopsis zonata CBS 506.65]
MIQKGQPTQGSNLSHLRATSDQREALINNDSHSEHPETSFFIDREGRSITPTGLPNPVMYTHSPSVTDSSEDEVVFTGRNNRGHSKSSLTQDQFIIDSLVQEPSIGQVADYRKDEDHLASRQSFSVSPVVYNMLSNKSPAERGITDLSDTEIHDGIDSCASDHSTSEKPSWIEHSNIQTTPASISLNTHGLSFESRVKDRTLLIGGEDSERHADDLNLESAKSYIPFDLESDHSSIQTDHSSNDSERDIDAHELGFLLGTDIGAQDIMILGKGKTQHLKQNGLGRRLPGKKASRRGITFSDVTQFDLHEPDTIKYNEYTPNKKPKGKLASFHLSDSELETELETELKKAYQNDRARKKIKKQQREELRSQGLLGRNKDKADLKVKYPDGMDIDDLKLEARTFLTSHWDSLALPPMDKRQRRLVHNMANAVSLKSQSKGSGTSRFPMLYKTSRTPQYTQKTISKVDQIFSGGKFERQVAQQWESHASSSKTKIRAGHLKKSVSYMDGDIVGGSAPEIGAQNKGRAMLEKMGWSIGTPLGASNNKGILLPVTHVVKNTRAGLG